MAKTDFIPNGTTQFLVWHDQFKTAATAIGATLGITPNDLAALGADNTDIHAKTAAAAAAAAAAQQATGNLRSSRRTVEANARLLAKRLKLHAGYTAALGEQLGIVGPEDSTDLSTSRPKLTAAAQPHAVVQIDFVKSKADGVNIYSQRGGEGWTFLARDTASPYVDNRPCLVMGQPEVRQYRAIYVVNDAEIGQTSDEVVVTCQP